jgi:shikimate dehydrogenase
VPAITGVTRLYGIVGDPIAQAKSLLRSTIASSTRRAATPCSFRCMCRPRALMRFFPALMEPGNLDGLVITLPFKERAVPYAVSLGTAGRLVGAINALRRDSAGRWTATCSTEWGSSADLCQSRP